MADPALVAVRTAHRGGADTLHARALVHVGFVHDQLIDVHRVRLVFGVGNCRAQHLLHRRGDSLILICDWPADED